ncbi:HAUS augmin-like complex subunit 1 [Basidiobolus ranarum]|uniref:HAUS augmin-like complex subunit 1 n=1 Tax=Basidiobolus ranarum TaxID=34480 RepID=A0ABR2WFT0_9FUNG
MIEDTMISDIYLCTPQHRRGLEKKRPNPAKLKKVQQWLKSKYGRNPIPKWEKTSETVDLLYDIVIHNEQQDEISPFIEEEEEKIAQEYRLEAQSMENCLNDIGLFIEDFQEDGSPLNALVSVAEKLGLADLELSSFFEGILDFSDRLNDLNLLNSARDTDLEAIEHYVRKLSDAKSKVDREIVSLEGEKEYNEALFNRFEIQNTEMEKWIKQIREKIANIESEIIPECRELSISSLWKLDSQIREAKPQLRSQHKQVKTYLDLPPDLELAKMKLEGKQTELEQLSHQREELISKMADGIQ